MLTCLRRFSNWQCQSLVASDRYSEDEMRMHIKNYTAVKRRMKQYFDSDEEKWKKRLKAKWQK